MMLWPRVMFLQAHAENVEKGERDWEVTRHTPRGGHLLCAVATRNRPHRLQGSAPVFSPRIPYSRPERPAAQGTC